VAVNFLTLERRTLRYWTFLYAFIQFFSDFSEFFYTDFSLSTALHLHFECLIG